MSDAAAGPAVDTAVLTKEPAVVACVSALRARFGDTLCAVLLYGSFLRGKRDTVLDFYVLLDDYAALGTGLERYANQLLPPNVYFLSLDAGAERIAAKYATLTLERFERALARDFHSYFWSRFAQPNIVVYARDPASRQRLEATTAVAAQRLLALTVPMLTGVFTLDAAWERAFRLTYGCELRAESPARAAELVSRYRNHLYAVFAEVADTLPVIRIGATDYRNASTPGQRRRAAAGWQLRKLTGKFVSLARLLKASFTFNDPLAYILWKIERHSGIHIEPTPKQRRHPLLFSWGLLWRIYKRGGFR